MCHNKPEIEDLITELEELPSTAGADSRRELTGQLSRAIVAAEQPLGPALASRALEVQQTRRDFDGLREVAEAVMSTGTESPEVQRRYAQSLIELKMFDAAATKLQVLQQNTNLSDHERRETTGLLGRVYKQRFIDHPNQASPRAVKDLQESVNRYYTAFDAAPEQAVWHGVNAAALIARAGRDGVALPTGLPTAEELGQKILGIIGTDPESQADVWSRASGAEASLAVGDVPGATRWIKSYLEHDDVNAFHIGSTLRQFTEVWLLDADDPDDERRMLVEGLEALTLGTAGGSLVSDGSGGGRRLANLTRDASGLEAVFGSDLYITIDSYRQGLSCAQSVVRIRMRNGGMTIGTGVVVPGNWLRDAWNADPVLVTNFHVVNGAGVFPGKKPGKVEVYFDERPQSPGPYRIDGLLFESPFGAVGTNPPEFVDTVVARLRDLAPREPSFELATALPDKEERVYVIGHPHGDKLAFSMQYNHLVARTQELLHYRSPTDPGSSGSPLFDQSWDLVGLHHAGLENMPSLEDPDEVYEANEGFTWDALQSRVS